MLAAWSLLFPLGLLFGALLLAKLESIVVEPVERERRILGLIEGGDPEEIEAKVTELLRYVVASSSHSPAQGRRPVPPVSRPRPAEANP